MISDEAVGAAAKAVHDEFCREPYHSLMCYDYKVEARAILEAAAPYMLPGARGKGDEAWDRNRVAIGDNPFRSQA